MPALSMHRVTCVFAIFLLCACQEKPQVIPQIRALKTFTVSEIASGQQRRFPGIVQATDSSLLSFEVGGKVQKVNVDIGDHVKKGQLLAVLDKEPYKLDVQAAKAELEKAKSDYRNKKQQFNRVDELVKKGWASKASWDAALSARDTSKNQINYANSKLNLATRDLRLTDMLAPFDGNIASRSVEPFIKVLPGQQLFEIHADGSLEVSFDVPETLIATMHPGMKISIAFPTDKEKNCEGRISFISSAAGVANSFPVKATLLAPPESIKPGMTADINITLASVKADTGYLVPFASVLPGDDKAFGYVYIYDDETATVKKTAIEIPDQAGQNNMVQIKKGVQAGDRIAIAGISFLTDGQQVKLIQP